MKTQHSILRICSIAATAVILFTTTEGSAQTLGTAGSYGVLGGSTVTNTGNTVITGDLGVSPGDAITGFSAIDGGPGLFSGALNIGNSASGNARSDATALYINLAAQSPTRDLTGLDLGGQNLTPGVYFFSSSAQLTGALTLNAQGNSDARFVFQIGSTLTTASDSVVNIINVGEGCGPDNGIFWQVGSSATLGTSTQFAGSILALTSITLNTGSNIDVGRALALNGAVTLDNNRIDASDSDGGFCAVGGPGISPVPEASTYGLVGSGVLLFAAWRRQRAVRRNTAQT